MITGSHTYKGFSNPAGSNKTGNLETQDEVDPIIERSRGMLAIINLTLSMTMGAIASMFVKRMRKVVFSGAGAVAVLFGYLSYNGIISVHASRFLPSLRRGRAIYVLTFGVSGFGLGFYLGVKHKLYNYLK